MTMNKKAYTSPQISIVEAEAVVMNDNSYSVSADRDTKVETVKSNQFFFHEEDGDLNVWKNADKE